MPVSFLFHPTFIPSYMCSLLEKNDEGGSNSSGGECRAAYGRCMMLSRVPSHLHASLWAWRVGDPRSLPPPCWPLGLAPLVAPLRLGCSEFHKKEHEGASVGGNLKGLM